MKQRRDSSNDLPVYVSRPPDWLPKTHASADIGYPGFYPPRPGQDEDVLSTSNVTKGFIHYHAVSAEHFSAQTTINQALRNPKTVTKLEDLINAVFARRAARVPAIPPSTFRIPSRVTLNDTKRQSYFADLANPDVPLYKLGKTVPHGAKGHDLLDLLQANGVAISRAVWFLRVFGANETAGLRNKPSYNPSQYSIEWTNVFTSYMKKQLGEITLPSAPRLGVNIKQTFKGVLAEADSRGKWSSKFSYSLELLRHFYADGMVDRKTFLTWVVHQLFTCNLAQVAFISRIAEEYFDGITVNHALSHAFVLGCTNRLDELNFPDGDTTLIGTRRLLISLLQRLCLKFPDAFISPRLWLKHSDVLEQSLLGGITKCTLEDESIMKVIQQTQDNLTRQFADIKNRNQFMQFRNLPSLVSAKLGNAVADIELLNSISHDSDMSSIEYFSVGENSLKGNVDKLDMLLSWSVTPLQFGLHRPFAAVTLLRYWKDRLRDNANLRVTEDLLQDHLFDWLDQNDIAGDASNLSAVALLYGELLHYGLFSYARYIQRLIARAEAGLSFQEDQESRHRRFLQAIPLINGAPHLNSQRRITLYGSRCREMPEAHAEREIRKEIRLLLPGIFANDDEHVFWASKTYILNESQKFITASRFEQVRIVRSWLLVQAKKKIQSLRDEDSASKHSVVLYSFCVVVELMAQTTCFHSILDLTLCLLEHATTVDLLSAVIDVLHRFSTMWACMDSMGAITTGLYDAHQVWKTRGVRSRALLTLLMEFDNGRYLDQANRDKVLHDLSVFTTAMHPTMDNAVQVPDFIPDILVLTGPTPDDAPNALASNLWIKYRGSLNWGWKVWDNTIASLRQLPTMFPNVEEREACALRYGAFLCRVDQHLPTGFDEQVLEWFVGSGRNEIAALSVETWDVVSKVLLYLIIHDSLKTTTLLDGLVYPAWKSAADLSTSPSSTEIFLHAANTLFSRLLLLKGSNNTAFERYNIYEIQCLQTRRQGVYSKTHFPALVENIPRLVALESYTPLALALRNELQHIRIALCEDPHFRRGVYQNLEAIKQAFEGPVRLGNGEGSGMEDLGERTISALRMVLCETTEDLQLSSWSNASSLLSPWKISATAVQLHFSLRQLGQSVSEGATSDTGAALEKLSATIFHHKLSSEEAYFVARMTKGVGGPVAGKFINNGLKCITEILSQTTLKSTSFTLQMKETLRRSSEILRVLIYVAEPLTPLPMLEQEVQDEFFEMLRVKFVEIERVFSESRKEREKLDVAQALVLLCRFVQFDLGFSGVWTPGAKERAEGLPGLIFRLILFHTGGDGAALLAYPVLVDTLYFLLDEMTSPIDPFRYYPTFSPSDLPTDLPGEYYGQLAALLPSTRPIETVKDLVGSGGAVVNRPWEWIENLGEQDGQSEEKYVIKNMGSLSLDSFAAHLTGSVVVEGENAQKRMMFEDTRDGDTIFGRDWREGRVGDVSVDVVGDPVLVRAEMYGKVYSPSTSSSRKQSPALSRSGSEVIDIDSLPGTSTSSGASRRKRKASVNTNSDEEPLLVKAKKVKTAAKAKLRKR